MKKYRFIDAQKASYRICMLCEILDVPESSYFDWNRTGRDFAAKRQAEDDMLFTKIKKINSDSRGSYGAPRIHEDLRDGGGVTVSKKRVARIMRDNKLQGVTNRVHKTITTRRSETEPKIADLVNRCFMPPVPDMVWYGDITYIWVNDKFWYLATVIDACTKQVVGWRFDDNMETGLVAGALESAVGRRGKDYNGVIFHTDRGSQYTSKQFTVLCAKLNVTQSMGRTGVCWDNAAAESFFSTIKRELINRYWFDTAEELHAELFNWIETWYNQKRRHSSIEYNSPNQAYAKHKQGRKNQENLTTV